MKIAEPRSARRIPRVGPLAAMLMLIAMLASAMLGASPAGAAEFTGYHVTFGQWRIGAFMSSNGQLVYCVEPGASDPDSAQHAPVAVETLEGYSATFTTDGTGWASTVNANPVSGEALRRMNWVLTKHGQTTDPNIAAVVQIAIWLLRAEPGTQAWMDYHLAYLEAHGGADHLAHARSLVNEAEAAVGPHPAPAPATPLTIALDAQPGSGRVEYPAGTTRLRLDGAVFENGSETLELDGTAAGSATWTAELHRPVWQREHRVKATADWQHSREEWPAAVMLHAPTASHQQGLGAMVGPVTATHRSELGPAEAVIDSRFSPVLTTRSEQPFVERGSGSFADRVTLSVAEGSAEWASRGRGDEIEHAPIVADGVLYGPFSQPQDVRQHAPTGAPVVGRAQIVADRGPGEYPVRLDAVPQEAGYYYWVWSVAEARQQPEVRAGELLPDGYRFSDRFGLAEEGQVVPSTLRWSTELRSRELHLDGLKLNDELRTTLHHGAWLRDAQGDRIPARVRLTVYGSDAEPVRAPEPPSDAREIARGYADVTGAGATEAPPIELPFETRGWVTVRACLLAEDQQDEHRGLIDEWCDDFGVPAETARVVLPEVRTEAQPSVIIGERFRDVAIVDGRVPAGADLGFTYYLAPVAGEAKYDENWQPRVDERGERVLWNAEELDAMTDSERCLAQPVAVTDRVPVPEAGRFASPEVVARSIGVGYWVEDLSMPHPQTGEPAEIHRGACGLENERTTVLPIPERLERPQTPREEPQTRLPDTGFAVDPRFALLGAVPLAGVGLVLIRTARRRRG